MVNPQTLQKEVMAWNAKNFPHAQPHHPLLGIVEEIGELMEAQSAIAVGKMAAEQGNTAARDAIGDAVIFMAVFCGMAGFSLLQLAEKHADDFSLPLYSEKELTFMFSLTLGKLCHAFLKDQQGIRGHSHRDVMGEQIGKLMCLLGLMCQVSDFDILECVDEAWAVVKERDWVKWPKTGRPPGEGSVKTRMKVRVAQAKERRGDIPKDRWEDEVPF